MRANTDEAAKLEKIGKTLVSETDTGETLKSVKFQAIRISFVDCIC